MTLKLRGTSHAKSLLKLFSVFYLPFIIHKASVNSSQKVEPLFRDVLNSKGITVWGNHLLQLIAKRVAMLISSGQQCNQQNIKFQGSPATETLEWELDKELRADELEVLFPNYINSRNGENLGNTWGTCKDGWFLTRRSLIPWQFGYEKEVYPHFIVTTWWSLGYVDYT